MIKLTEEQYGIYSRYSNGDGSMSIYRDLKFIAAIENTTASCDLFRLMATEIESLKAQLAEKEVGIVCLRSLYNECHATKEELKAKLAEKDALLVQTTTDFWSAVNSKEIIEKEIESLKAQLAAKDQVIAEAIPYMKKIAYMFEYRHDSFINYWLERTKAVR